MPFGLFEKKPVEISNDDVSVYLRRRKPMAEDGVSLAEFGSLAAATAVPIGINSRPFVIQYNKLMSPGIEKKALALSNDIVTDNIITTDSMNKLVKASSDYLNPKKVRIYKYKGKKRTGIGEVVNKLGEQVSDQFIYEAISGKKMYTEDQLAYDEDFEEINIKAFMQETADDIATILNKIYLINHGGLPAGKLVTSNEAKRVLYNADPHICIFESDNGYYAINKKTLRCTNLFNSIGDIVIQEDLNNE